MADKSIQWDAVDYLQTEEDIVDYLAAALETGEASDLIHALATVARAYNG